MDGRGRPWLAYAGRVNRLLRFLGPALAVAALFALPALRLVLPMLPPAQWSVAGMAAEIMPAARSNPPAPPGARQPDLRELLRQARTMQQQFGGGGDAGLQRGFAAAALIPAAALAAGVLALLSWLWLLLGWRAVAMVNAAGGAAAALYAIGASAWLTHLARAAAAQAMARMQQNLSGIMRTLDWGKLGHELAGNIGLVPEAGLYVLLLAFLAILLAPPAQRRPPVASDGPAAN